jgi:Polysaccharide pyruvyl transferase.
MRIGILTFHFNYNYGAVLQAYASVCALRALGHEPEIVNYVPSYLRADASYFRGLGIRNGGWRTKIWARLTDMPRRLKFDSFRRRHLPVSRRVKKSGLAQLGDSYDILYVGSDQVWNLNWMHDFDGFYFCDYLSESSKARPVAYAACFGAVKQPEGHLRKASSLIRRFQSVGVRNQMSSQMVANIAAGVASQLVCDPTLLHDFSDIRVRRDNGDYIVVYALDAGGVNRAKDYCDAIKKELGNMPVWFIRNDRVASVPWADRVVSDADPGEWLNLIADARAVVTDSFHGCIFAMKYKRTLRAYSSGWRAMRMLELFGHLEVSYVLDGGEDFYLWKVDGANDALVQHIQDRMKFMANESKAWLGKELSLRVE